MKIVRSRWLIVVVWCMMAATVGGAASARAAHATDSIGTRYVSESGATLEQLSEGAVGAGVIFYYPESQGPDRPSIAVRLSKQGPSSYALAEVYEPFPGSTYLHLSADRRPSEGDASYNRAITLISLDGWWTHGASASFNLNVQVYGPMYAMWGAAYDPKYGLTGWTKRVHPGEATVAITVRDPAHTGVPEWEWRDLLPEFKGGGYYRTNYAQTMCSRPRRVLPSISPLWPYVTTAAGYEQIPGQFSPPIGVDWTQGKITHFSELVTVRNQACSYALYSLDRLRTGVLNRVDFESPFAFYDLSNHAAPYPNLIIRAEHYPAQDPWTNALIYPGSPLSNPVDISWIRYSWGDAPGDSAMRYKIDVMGAHVYGGDTLLAGGMLRVDAPSYRAFPTWVVHRSWPIVTFVDTEGTGYRSAEGIYEYSSRDAGFLYALGWDDKPYTRTFELAESHLRGEYRVATDGPPRLYFSPIDNRLHLVAAEGGTWDIGQGSLIALHNLEKGDFIDGWTVEEARPEGVSTIAGKRIVQSRSTGRVLESLYTLSGYILYAGPAGVRLQRSHIGPAAFKTSPPYDTTSWRSLRDTLRRLARAVRDPHDLAGWTRNAPGPSMVIKDAGMADVRAWKGGFRFVLHVGQRYGVAGNPAPFFSPARAGDYVVTYDGRFTVAALTPPHLSARVAARGATLRQLEIAAIPIALRNDGLQDLSGASLELLAGQPDGRQHMVATRTVTLLAGQSYTTALQWSPPTVGVWTVRLRVRTASGGLFTFPTAQVDVAPSSGASLNTVLDAHGSQRSIELALLLGTAAALLAGIAFTCQLRIAQGTDGAEDRTDGAR